MNQIIIYKQDNGVVAIVRPTEEALNRYGIEAIAIKDVPANHPYWIVDASVIPSDRSQRNAWEIDASIGDPHGFGGESDEFTDAQLLELYKAGVIE